MTYDEAGMPLAPGKTSAIRDVARPELHDDRSPVIVRARDVA